jgi:hypothetical protein
LLLEGATGALLGDEETGLLLEEDDFTNDEEAFLLGTTGLTVTVDFLMMTEDEEAVLAELVKFKMLETVSFLPETGLRVINAFFWLVLDTLALLVVFLELVGTLVLEDFSM